MEGIEAIKKTLSYPKDIVITTHRNPDGDAIGSSLGLLHYLKNLGHAVKVICPSDYPDFLGWMPGIDHVIIFDTDTEEATSFLTHADLDFLFGF